MKSSDSESISFMNARKQMLIRVASISVIALLVLFVAVLAFKHVKSASYARLAPVGVSVELSYYNQLDSHNELLLEYNYGYGFIPGHSQSRVITSAQEPQILEFSISSWKPIRAIRLRIKNENGVIPHAATFNRLGESTRVLLTDVDEGVLLDLDEVEMMFSGRLHSAEQPRSS